MHTLAAACLAILQAPPGVQVPPPGVLFLHGGDRFPDQEVVQNAVSQAAEGRFELVYADGSTELEPKALKDIDAALICANFGFGDLSSNASLERWVRSGGALARMGEPDDGPYSGLLCGASPGRAPWNTQVTIKWRTGSIPRPAG